MAMNFRTLNFRIFVGNASVPARHARVGGSQRIGRFDTVGSVPRYTDVRGVLTMRWHTTPVGNLLECRWMIEPDEEADESASSSCGEPQRRAA